MADRLFLGPLRGREPGLDEICCGYLANPMVQPRASLPALASIAGYLCGTDPEQAWADDRGDLRVFAEACDGEVPRRLVADVDRRRRLRRARVMARRGRRRVAAPGLEERPTAGSRRPTERPTSVAPLCGSSTRSQRRRSGHGHEPGAGRVGLRMAGVRRSEVTVMGPRCSVRPVLGQRDRRRLDPRLVRGPGGPERHRRPGPPRPRRPRRCRGEWLSLGQPARKQPAPPRSHAPCQVGFVGTPLEEIGDACDRYFLQRVALARSVHAAWRAAVDVIEAGHRIASPRVRRAPRGWVRGRRGRTRGCARGGRRGPRASGSRPSRPSRTGTSLK